MPFRKGNYTWSSSLNVLNKVLVLTIRELHAWIKHGSTEAIVLVKTLVRETAAGELVI